MVARLCLTAFVFFAGGCSAPTDAPLAAPPAADSESKVAVSLVVSDPDAALGSIVAISIETRTPDGQRIAGLHAVLRYDPLALGYHGIDVPDRPLGLTFVNDEEPGVARVVAAGPHGLNSRPAVLLFEVKDRAWINGLRIAEAVVTTESLTSPPVWIASKVAVELDLVVGEPDPLADRDWSDRLGWPTAPPAFSHLAPGEPVLYGDASGDGEVNVFDALLMGRIAARMAPAPTGDAMEATNLFPFNTSDGVEGSLPDPCRPGRTCTAGPPYSETGPGVIDVVDVLAVSQAVALLPVPVVGRAVPDAATIGPAGGTIRPRGSGALLAIAGGALATPTLISVVPLADPVITTGVPVVVPGTMFQFGPGGLSLAVPAVLTLDFDPATIPGGPSAANRLGIYRLAGGVWAAASGAVLNATANTMTAAVSTLGTYVLGRAPGDFPLPGPNSMYFNSFEPGCGTDANVLFCDDFEDGDWYTKDCDQATASGGLLQTDGWCGTIYNSVGMAAGTARCGGVGVRSNCAATTGVLTGTTGNMADHAFTGGQGVNEVWVRFYTKPLTGYQFGAEKMLTFNDGGPGGAGIRWGNLGSNCGSSTQSTGTIAMGIPVPQDECMRQNIGTSLPLLAGNWYFYEAHYRLPTPGQANGLFELWVDNCGPSGTSCPPVPTLRMRRTDVRPTRSAASEMIRVLWFEAWSNAQSRGERYWDQIKASRVGPIGR